MAVRGDSRGPIRADREELIRALFDDYIEMYASRDPGLTTRFSENFSGYTGGGSFLVKDMDEWVQITRQDFTQVPKRIRIEMLDISLQDLSDDVVIVTAFFRIHLPLPEHVLSRETARLVLAFRREGPDWKIAHSGSSLPYHLVRDGEVYPLKALYARSHEFEDLVEERTRALEEANDKLKALSNTDGLTGVGNRRSFDDTLAVEWKRASRLGTPLGLVMLDVDLFKHFNDRHGHQAGDSCLKALAHGLTEAGWRSGELVARYGGEEFVVLLPGSDEREAMGAARRIQHKIWSLALPHAETSAGTVTVSMGVASMIPCRATTPDDLVRQADAALYRAKQRGRNRVELATA